MKKLLPSLLGIAMCIGVVSAQVGINTNTPQSTLDVNGNIQIRNELRINGNAGLPGQIYFSQGPSTVPQWKTANVTFLEDGQYQLVNTFAKKDQTGIDWVGSQASFTAFTETFEANSPTKGGWTNEIVVAGSPNWNLSAAGSTATITTARSGAFNARFGSAATTSGHRTRLVSPRLNFAGYSNLTLRYWYAQPQNGSTTNQNYHGVWYRTSTNGTVWTAWTQIGSNVTNNQGSWVQTAAVALPSSAGSEYYQIAFDGLQRGTGHGIAIDDIEIISSIASSGYQQALSPLGELINAKNWVRIPSLDLPVTINNGLNKITITFQSGVESKMSTATTGNQVAGNIRFLCGLFRRQANQPLNSASLIAVRGDQINNTINKPIMDKTQGVFTLNYTVNDTPAGSYVFSTACRRISITDGGGAAASSFLSIGNSANTGNNVSNDFMLNSILKMDVIELVTTTTP